MSTMSERVSLPDPSARRLLHPTDVAQAHPTYVHGWAMSILAAPEILTLVAALAWVLSGSWIAPTLAVLSTGVVAELARRHLMSEAWAHIPRKRQDRPRDTPAPYALIEAVIRPAAMVGGRGAGAEIRGGDAGDRVPGLHSPAAAPAEAVREQLLQRRWLAGRWKWSTGSGGRQRAAP